MDSPNQSSSKFMEFPYVSTPHRDLMVELVSSLESKLDSSLLPCTLPPDVQYVENPSATAHASFHIRLGSPSSQIDFIREDWVHCEFPSGAAVNITTLSAYLKPSTDAPNLVLFLAQRGPTSLVFILDLTPRKDLIFYRDYLKTYYEETKLDGYRQRLQTLPEVKPYAPPSLFLTALASPTAILFSIETQAGETARIEEIIRDHISPVAKKIVKLWLDKFACEGQQLTETEQAYLAVRDRIIKYKTIGISLGPGFAKYFGEEVATRVLKVLEQYHNA